MKAKYLVLPALAASAALTLTATAAPKKVIVVTATAGFRHSSIETAENVIATLGQQSGAFTVVDYVRGRTDGKDDATKAANVAALTTECAAKLSLDRLNAVDGVIFANTTGDLPLPDKDGFIKWVEAGHGFVGMHSCSDTFHGFRPFIDLVGGEFLTHGAQVQVQAYNQDPAFPSNRHLGESWVVFDEIYEFKSFYRPKVHGLLTLDKHPQTLVGGDYPVAWCKNVGQGAQRGKMWYTSLGHREDVWTSSNYQRHILGGIKWSLGVEQASAEVTSNWNVPPLADAKEGFRRIFDGRSLNGWKYRRENGNKSWSVENGMLCNVLKKDEHGTDIYSEEKFRDFIVRYEYQAPPKSNSGFYLRGRHEIQIMDGDSSSKNGNGAIYNVAAPAIPAPRKAGEWQEVEAKIVGQKITVILNGVLIHDNVLCEKGTGSQLDDNVDQPGPILLQGDHGSVTFRNIRIKAL